MPSRRALIVCPEPPYPLHGGGAFRTAAVLQYLARNYELDAVFFSEETRPDPRRALPPGLVRDSLLIRLPVHSRSTPAILWRNAWRYVRGVPPLVDRFTAAPAPEKLAAWLASRQRYDVAVLEHFWSAPFARQVRPHTGKLVLDLHNIESEWHARMARTDRWPFSHAHRRFAAAARRLERQLLADFDTVMVTSKRESAQPGLELARVYPNTIPSVPAVTRARRLQIGQRVLGAGAGEQARDLLRGVAAGAQRAADERRDHPPARAHVRRRVVELAADADHRQRGQQRGGRAAEQDGGFQEVAEAHVK